jgi:hypothetical protein
MLNNLTISKYYNSTLNPNAEVSISPHVSTVRTNTWVPFYKLSEGDLVVADDLGADYALGDVMEFVAVANHARLRREGCRDIVTGRCGLGAGGRTCGRCLRNFNAVVSLGPETTAVVADSWVPRHKVLHGEGAVFVYNLSAGVLDTQTINRIIYTGLHLEQFTLD